MLACLGSAQVLLYVLVEVEDLHSIRLPAVNRLDPRPHAAGFRLPGLLVGVIFIAAAVVFVRLFRPKEGQLELFEHYFAVRDV